MTSLTTRAAVLIAAVLALALLAYVFLDGSTGANAAAPHCTSREALAQVKQELFRRAAVTRGGRDAVFANAADQSVVVTTSRMVRHFQGDSDKVTCTGIISLQLPRGIAPAGAPNLRSPVAYELERHGGGARLTALAQVDSIVGPLSSIGIIQQSGAPTTPADQPEGKNVAPPPPSPLIPVPQGFRRPAPAPVPPAPPRPSKAKKAPPSSAVQKPSTPAPKTDPNAARNSTPAPLAAATPSFNCRYARTGGEIAVCRNPQLAALDRAMASQFYRALAGARPGQRKMLERSRSRFLAYRDSCGSEACIADAYRGRIKEISDIMSGGF